MEKLRARPVVKQEGDLYEFEANTLKRNAKWVSVLQTHMPHQFQAQQLSQVRDHRTLTQLKQLKPEDRPSSKNETRQSSRNLQRTMNERYGGKKDEATRRSISKQSIDK